MSIIRINEFQAKEGQGSDLLELLNSSAPIPASTEGLHSYQILQNLNDPTRIVVIETWDTVEAHQRSAKKIPVSVFEKAVRMMSTPPKGDYYRS
jgi:quinol monooxygenase YgiN